MGYRTFVIEGNVRNLKLKIKKSLPIVENSREGKFEVNVSSPENILCRLQRSYADKAVSGGTVVKLDTKRNPLLTEQSVEVLILKHKT